LKNRSLLALGLLFLAVAVFATTTHIVGAASTNASTTASETQGSDPDAGAPCSGGDGATQVGDCNTQVGDQTTADTGPDTIEN
jgi:hypothetical protein